MSTGEGCTPMHRAPPLSPAHLARERPLWYNGSVSEPCRTTVLDALTQFGGALSMSEASAKYGVPTGTIKRWAKERREGRVVPLKVAPPEVSRASGRALVKVALERDRILAEGLGEQLRADYRETFTNLLSIAKARTRAALDGPPLIDGVPDEEWVAPDMREVKAITEALGKLAEHGSAILGMDRDTAAPEARAALDNPATVAAEIARRRRA